MGRWIVVCRPGRALVAVLTVMLDGHEVAEVREDAAWTSDDLLLINPDVQFPDPPFDLDPHFPRPPWQPGVQFPDPPTDLGPLL